MSSYFVYISICLLSAAVALALTPVVKLLALKYGWLDAPSNRKVHQQPMVRLGGIAIFCSTLLAVGWIGWGSQQGLLTATEAETALCLLMGGSGFFLIGFTDDLFALSAFQRLWMQSAVAIAAWALGIRIDELLLPGLEPVALSWLSLPLTVVWLVGVVNAINWIDGLDGLAAGIAGIAACVLMLLAVVSTQPMAIIYVGLALIGGLFGFWCYNYSPAEIFMGDGGAYFVGFMLGGLCITGSNSLNYSFATVLPIVVLAVPLADMVSVIAARLWQGKSPFAADNRHLHHRLLGAGFSEKQAVATMHCLSLWCGSLALVMVEAINGWVFALVSVCLLVIIARLIARVREMAMNNSDVVDGGAWYSKSL